MARTLVAKANILVFGVLIALIAVTGFTTWDRFNATRSAREWTLHTYDVLGAVRELGIAVRDAETDERGYLLTGRSSFLEAEDEALQRTSVLIADLRRLTVDNPDQQARLDILVPDWQRRTQQFAQAVEVRRTQGLEGVIGIMGPTRGRETMQEIERTLTAMTAEEKGLLSQRLRQIGDRSQWVGRLVVGTTVLTVLAMLWAARSLNQAYRRSNRAEIEQRALAARLRASLESLSQGVGVFGPDQTLRHWNKCFQTLLVLPPETARIGTPFAVITEQVAAEDGPLPWRTDYDERQQPSEAGPVVHEWTHPNGRLLEICRTPTADAGFVLTISDMTERARSETILRESQKMQAIGQLTGGIAHDFNNLLTVIMGNLELARMKLEPASPLAKNIERSLWAAQRGGTLTSQLLAFARKQPLAPAPVDLSVSLPELVPLLERTLGAHIDIRFVGGAGLWPAMADPVQLEAAVLNLALNARDAMQDGGRLTIELANKILDAQYTRAYADVVPGDYVMVAVSDTGHGMTQDVAARAFEPFFTTKTDGRGTGLGLAMVFGFVKQSGGHVAIYSEPGEGTSVKIYLPRALEEAVPSSPVERFPTPLPRGTATILVVEDEAHVREVATTILRSLGYHVLEAANGEDGLRAFNAHAEEVDLLLTDVMLPGPIRGRELAEQVSAARPELRVLFMSGYTENSIVHHGRLDAGVQLLGKPFKREQLAHKVAEVLGATVRSLEC